MLCGLAGSCRAVQPFEGAPRVEIGKEDVENASRVAVCYNGLFSTPVQVKAVAVQACGPGFTPYPIGQDIRFACPLMTPVRATFSCVGE